MSRPLGLWKTRTYGVGWLLIAFLANGAPAIQADQSQASQDNPAFEDVQEDVHPYLTDRFRFHIGAFAPKKSYKLSADGSITGDHPQIDFDETFGLSDTENVVAAEFHWRFGEKWFFESHYYEIKEEGGAVLEEDIIWRDVTFPAGSYAETELRFEVARLFFGRRLVTKPNSEFSVGVGAHWMDIDAFIEGEILLGGGGSRFHREEVGLEGPLPNIGFSYIYSTSPKWAFLSSVDWLSLSIDKWSGGFWDISVGGSYHFTRNFSVNLQYMFVDIDVTYDDPDWRGDLDITFKGPLLTVGWSW